MKLRKKEIEVPMNFPFPRWITSNIYGRISRLPPPFNYCHRDVDELVCYNASALVTISPYVQLLEIFAIFVAQIKSVTREKKLLERLYQLRTERQIPSQDLAKALGVEPPMYSRMERGSRNIKMEHLKKIAEFYHVDCDALHALWVADKLREFAQGLPQEVFEQAISILNRERDKDNGAKE